MQPNNNIPQPVLDEVLGVMKEIDAELSRVAAEDGAPEIKSHMSRISANLRKFPDLVHLLTDAQIEPYYKAALKIADVVLMPIKKSAAKKKDAVAVQADIDNDDLFGL